MTAAPILMPRASPRLVLAGKTRAERRRLRAGISLKAISISPKTRQRYEAAVGAILPFLEAQDGSLSLDHVISEWVELQWVLGESVNTIADCLSGLHYFRPDLKGTLKQAWKLFSTWRRVESPSRAPPITAVIVKAFIARAVESDDLDFAVLVALGFHSLLRTGELLALQYQDFELGESCGVVTLKSSKTGLRHGSEEAVAIRDRLTLMLLDTLFSWQPWRPGNRIWPFSPQAFRETFRRYLGFFRVANLSFKPYSMRRGGATLLLQEGVPLDVILLRGRWRSLAVARIYLEDALAQIPQMRIPPPDFERILLHANQCPQTAFQP